MSDWDAPYQDFLKTCADTGRFRSLTPVGPSKAGRTMVNGREMINFSSNNYMGLAEHPLLRERAHEWAGQYGAGAMASRLVCGTLELHERVENRLVEGKGGESGLIFNSGFQGNFAILSALLDKAVLGHAPLVFCDRLNHASMHAGIAQAGARQIRYRHNDLNHLESLLQKHAESKVIKFIIGETVFSMDGDQAPVADMIALAQKYNARLYLDEAHAMGVLGPDGFGLCAHKAVDFKMGTFSKALGGFGAYLVCSGTMRDYLVNKSQGMIYSTALPPAVLGAMDAALELLPGLSDVRSKLLKMAQKVRDAVLQSGFSVGQSTTQIVPVIVGDAQKTIEMSKKLNDMGILAIAIRPPTVPTGESRLRLAITAAHCDEDIDYLCECLKKLSSC